jgi:hypothetical protein
MNYAGELFNRVLGRKKYLCRCVPSRSLKQSVQICRRSRAIQVGLNVSVLEDWIDRMGLPQGVQSHFSPVRDLLTWLQVRVHHFIYEDSCS